MKRGIIECRFTRGGTQLAAKPGAPPCIAVMYPKVSGLPLVNQTVRPSAAVQSVRKGRALSTLIFSGRRWTLELC